MSCLSRFRIRYEDQNTLIVIEYPKSSKNLQNHIIRYQIDPKPLDNISPFTLNSSQTFLSPNYIKTRIEVYETLCPQQMLVHKGGKIKNWGGECRDVTPTKSLSQNIRVDVNREVKFL